MPEGIITKQLWDPFFERFRAREMQQESCKTAHRYKIDMRLPSCPPCSYSSQSNTVWTTSAALSSLSAANSSNSPHCTAPAKGLSQHSTRGQFLLADRQDDSGGAQGRSKGLVITWTHKTHCGLVIPELTELIVAQNTGQPTPNWEHWCVHTATAEQGLGNFAVSNPCSAPNTTVLHSATPALRAFYWCYTKMKRRNICFAQQCFTVHSTAPFCCTILNRQTNLAKCSAAPCCSCNHDVQL